MALASRIDRTSASPPSYQIPSITSPIERNTREIDDSSPQLPSPSTFVKPRTSTLKSGSKALPLPQHAASGFASVRSLWKEETFAVESLSPGGTHFKIPAHQRKDATAQPVDESRKSTGKLVKQKKEERIESKHFGQNSASPKRPAKQNVTNATTIDASKHPRPDVYEVPLQPPSLPRPESHKSDSPLSKFKYAESDTPSKTHTSSEGVKPAKKSRSKKATAEKRKSAPAKRPKKQKAKSEEFVLNSDEPEPGDTPVSVKQQQPVEAREGETQAKQSILKPKKRSARKRKTRSAPAPSQQLECHAGDGRTATKMGEVAVSSGGAEESIYFAKQAAPNQETTNNLQPLSAKTSRTEEELTAIVHELGQFIAPVETASKRRLSWTPPKDTTTVTVGDSRPPTAGSELSDTLRSPRMQLTDILGQYSYNHPENQQISHGQRSPTGEAAMKRRRIELSDATTTNTAKRKVVANASAKPAKAPRKPQTITAVATAAFQINRDTDDTTSVFSAVGNRSRGHEAGLKTVSALQSTTKKVARPRKSRAKASTGKGPPEPKRTGKESNKSRGRKSGKKVKFIETKHRPRLYSPSHAAAQIRKQDFLFGTSSQLAPAESPKFIKDLQAALRESEQIPLAKTYQEDFASQTLLSSPTASSSQKKSYIRVPTAPHGTCLSIEQANTHLWRVAARDIQGAVFRPQRDGMSIVNADGDLQVQAVEGSDSTALGQVDVQIESKACNATSNDCTSQLLSNKANHAAQTLEEGGRRDYTYLEAPITDSRTASHHEILQNDHLNAVLGQNSAVAYPDTPPKHAQHTASALSGEDVVKFASPRMFRKALHPLDSNTNLVRNVSPVKALAVDDSWPESSAASDRISHVPQPHARRMDSKAFSGSPSISPKSTQRPARPLFIASSPTRSKLLRPTGGAATSQSAVNSKWMDVDEISDSESPTTPSPPRRCSSSPPLIVRSLVLTPSRSRTGFR